MQRNAIYLLTILCVTSGCASITGTRNQPVTITTTSEGKYLTGASCILSNDKGSWYVTTPGSVTIRKAYGDLGINCKKDDYVGAACFQSESEAATWGNIVLGGLIGYAVDAESGAGFSYPSIMNVDMTQASKTIKNVPPCKIKTETTLGE